MVQGTASSVGKSVIATALCRIFRQDGFRVAPFKAQNMALNSFVTADGGEIGRSQVVQAEAAGIEPNVDMNPVLLKPEADSQCQVIVLGRVARTISAGDYYQHTSGLLETIKGALDRLQDKNDIVVIEGAGSPAEINLREREIVNMRVARIARSPVLLVGDIDRGGVFASLIGTLQLLGKRERDYVKGLIINKFRGDLELLKPGLEFLEKRTARPVIGVLPYWRDICIAQEDSVYLDEPAREVTSTDLDIAIIRLPHIANYDDFDPLEAEGCRVRYVTRPREVGHPHLIVLPGTKSTMSDLQYLRESGFASEVLRQANSATPIIGICGGYQMLGRTILDPYGVESSTPEVSGLGLLDAVTTFVPEKSTSQVRSQVCADHGLLEGLKGQEITAYEIHMGQTTIGDNTAAFRIHATPQGEADYGDGTLNAPGTVLGTYLHGLFHNSGFRQGMLTNLRRYWGLPPGEPNALAEKEEHYDRLADMVRRNLNIAAIYQIMESGIP